ncbi:MAG: bactofilin family protein [Nitrospirota bacterium]
MFSKKSEKLEALVGHQSEFKGDIVTQGTFRVDGKYEGNITADWVVIGEKGTVNGDIIAKNVVIGGKLSGNIKAEELVEIKQSGQIYGEIVSRKLSIAEGATFEGRSLVQKEDSNNVVNFPAKEATSI